MANEKKEAEKPPSVRRTVDGEDDDDTRRSTSSADSLSNILADHLQSQEGEVAAADEASSGEKIPVAAVGIPAGASPTNESTKAVTNDSTTHKEHAESPTPSTLLRTESGALVPPTILAQQGQTVRVPGAYAVVGPIRPSTSRRDGPADNNGNSSNTIDVSILRVGQTSHTGDDPDGENSDVRRGNIETAIARGRMRGDGDDELLIEATLVDGDSNLQFEPSLSQQHDLIVQASPMEEMNSTPLIELTFQNLLTHPKVLALLCLVVLLVTGIVVGISLGASSRKSKDDSRIEIATQNSEFSQQQKDALLERLSLTSNSKTLAAIQIPDTPQARAFQWMLEDARYDNVTSPNNDDIVTTSTARQRQRFAMVTFYYATNGDEWTFHDTWLQHATHECDWRMISEYDWEMMDVEEEDDEDEDAVEDEIGDQRHFRNLRKRQLQPVDEAGGDRQEDDKAFSIYCPGGDGVVREILLVDNNLVGNELPVELFTFMPELEVLELRYNGNLFSPIPSEIGMLSGLLELSLVGCSISELLPSQLGLLEDLQYLSLAGNQISGPIPSGKSTTVSVSVAFKSIRLL